jgi:hypothetical protein
MSYGAWPNGTSLSYAAAESSISDTSPSGTPRYRSGEPLFRRKPSLEFKLIWHPALSRP